MEVATEVKSVMEVTIEMKWWLSTNMRVAMQMEIEVWEVVSTIKSAMEVVTKIESVIDYGKVNMEVAAEM